MNKNENYINIPLITLPILGVFTEEEWIIIVNRVHNTGLLFMMIGMLTTNVLTNMYMNLVSFFSFTWGGLMFFGTMNDKYLYKRFK